MSIYQDDAQLNQSVDISKNYAQKKQQTDNLDVENIIAEYKSKQVMTPVAEPQKPLASAIKAATDGEQKEEVGTAEDVLWRGVVGGVRDAIQETNDALVELGTYFDENYYDLGVIQLFDEDGNWNLDYISRAEAKEKDMKMGIQLPEVDKPDSISGNLTRGVSQFITGFIPAMKGVGLLTKGKSVSNATKAGQAVAATAVTDFTVFDPHAERLSNLMQEYPVLQNPVSEYLQAKPTDSSAEGRFKNVVEGLILDATVASAFMGSVKMLRSAKSLSGADPKAVKEVMPEFTQPREKAPVQIYDETKPLVEEVVETPSIADDVFKGTKVVDESDNFVKVFHGTNLNFDDFSDEFLGGSTKARSAKKGFWFTSDEQVARGYGELANEQYVDDLLQRSRQAEIEGDFELSEKLTREAEELEQSIDVTENVNIMERYVDTSNFAEYDAKGARFVDTEDNLNDFIDKAKSEGKDGVKVKNFMDNAGYGDDTISDHFILFSGKNALKEKPIRDKAKAEAQVPAKVGEVAEEVVSVFEKPIAMKAGGKSININLDRLNTSDDIKGIIDQTSQLLRADIDKARRGTISNEETRLAAEQIGMTPDQLLARQEGEAFNAEQIVAARDMLVSSGQNLKEMAEQIRSGDATDIDRIKFRNAVATHAAIQKQVSGLTAEAGRALQAFKIQAQTQAEQTRAIRNIINDNGGNSNIDKMVEAISSLDDPAKLNKFIEKSYNASTMDMIFEAWTNSLLSAPTTHLTNIAGNTLTAMLQAPERAMGAIISKLPKIGSGQIEFQETIELGYGFTRGAVDGWKMAKEAFKTEGMQDPLTKLDVADRRAITAENLSRSMLGKYMIDPALKTVGAKTLDQAGYASSMADFMGSAVRFAGYRMLSSEDAFFKGLNYRMELQAGAYRMASQMGLTGEEKAKAIADFIASPPKDLMESAMNQADVNTFTNYNELASKVNAFREAFPAIKFALPFVTTPANIVSYAVKRSPLAPLSKQFRDDITRGGVDRDLALGRLATGSMAMWAFYDMAAQGVVTGSAPSDPALRTIWLQENQEYSFKFKDENGKPYFVSYNRFEPIGMLAGIAADVQQIRAGMSQQDEDDITSAALMAINNNLLSKTYMSGLSDLIAALDPTQYQTNIGDFAANSIAGFVPNFINSANRTFIDQTLRDTKNVNVGFDNQVSFINKTIDKIKSKVPAYSDDLPARRNLWGEVIEARQGFNDGVGEMIYNFLSPAYVKTADNDPVNNWLLENDIGVRMPQRNLKVPTLKKPVKLSAQEYNTYVELSGKPAKKELDRLINSKAFEGYTDEQKADGVRRIITGYRRQAKQQLLQLYPEIIERARNVNQQ